MTQIFKIIVCGVAIKLRSAFKLCEQHSAQRVTILSRGRNSRRARLRHRRIGTRLRKIEH